MYGMRGPTWRTCRLVCFIRIRLQMEVCELCATEPPRCAEKTLERNIRHAGIGNTARLREDTLEFLVSEQEGIVNSARVR